MTPRGITGFQAVSWHGLLVHGTRYSATCGIGFQPMVAVLRDIDRYSDRAIKSGAIFFSPQKIASLVLNRLGRCSCVHEHRLKACATTRAPGPWYVAIGKRWYEFL
jgi:hypothetical protein